MPPGFQRRTRSRPQRGLSAVLGAGGFRAAPASGAASRLWPMGLAARATATRPAAWRRRPPCRSSRKPNPRRRPPTLMREIFDAAAAQSLPGGPAQGAHGDDVARFAFPARQGHHCACRGFAGLSDSGGKIKRLTTDHSYTALQVKLGLLLERNAMTSPHRSTLTRSIGYEPMCHYRYRRPRRCCKGDLILQCTDGLYGFILDDEILDAVRQVPSRGSLQAADRPGGKAPGQRQCFGPDRPGVGRGPAPASAGPAAAKRRQPARQ